MKKRCQVCLKEKEVVENFYSHHTYKDNYANICKACKVIYHRERRQRLAEERKGKPRYRREPFFYNSRIPRPPDPKHAITIQQEPIKVVFD